MANFKISTKGNKAVLKKLRDIEKQAQTAIKSEMEAALYEIQGKAVSKVPVDTGVLKNSIRVDAADIKNLKGSVIAEADYAPYVEFGTGALVDVPEGLEDYAIQFKGQGKRQVNLPPRPFLIPAWEQERLKLVDNIEKAIENELK